MVFSGYRASVVGDEKVLGVEAGDEYTALRKYLMPPNCTFTNGSNGKFYVMYISPQ